MTNKDIISIFEPGFKVIAKDNHSEWDGEIIKDEKYIIKEIIWGKDGVWFFVIPENGGMHIKVGAEVFDLQKSAYINHQKKFNSKMDELLGE